MDLERIIGTLITDTGPKPFVLHTQTGLLELDAYTEPDEAQIDLSVTQQQRFVQLIAERTDVSFAKVRLGQYHDPKRDRWVDAFSEDEEDIADLARLKRGTLSSITLEAEKETPSPPEQEASAQTPSDPEGLDHAVVEPAEPVPDLQEPEGDLPDLAVLEPEVSEPPAAGIDEVASAPAEPEDPAPVAPVVDDEPVPVLDAGPAIVLDEEMVAEEADGMSEAGPIEIEIVPPPQVPEEAKPQDVEPESEDIIAVPEQAPGAEQEPLSELDDPEEEGVVARMLDDEAVIDAVLLPDSTVMLEKAIRIAVEAHGGQFDKAGKPYILHPLRMMFRMRSPTEMMAAVLHDVVEDTGWTLEALRYEGFSDDVVEAVDGLTRRKEETYAEFIKRAAHHPVARAVKLVDIEDNMDIRRLDTLTDKDKSRLARYLKAWQWLTADRKSDDFL